MGEIVSTTEIPQHLKPYIFHGVELTVNGGEAGGVCPFCDKPKFTVSVESGLYQCWGGRCGVKGNSVTFIRDLWNLCLDTTSSRDYETLREQSGFVEAESAKEYGVAKSVLNDKWLVPGFNIESKMTGLYKFTRIKEKDKWVQKLLPTPGLGHHLFNVQNYIPQKPIVDLTEGWRDGIAWYECMKLGVNEGGVSYLKDRNVLSVPGTNSFKPQWGKFFAGKEVNILFDNDHIGINEKTNQPVDGAGLKGVKRVASMLMAQEVPPVRINYIAWNDDRAGSSDGLPDGYDLRDHLSASS